MKLQRKGLTATIFVLALGLTAVACFKKEEAPQTEDMAPAAAAPATGTTEEGAAPAAPAAPTPPAAPENGVNAEAPKH